MKKRNGLIDLEKFVFSIIIVLYHAGSFYNTEQVSLCGAGYIAVEFFFMVSGYLMVKKAERETEENIWKANVGYLFSRIKGIFPYMILAVLVSNLFYLFGEFSFLDLWNHLVLSLVDIFGLQMLGFLGYYATGVSWYLSVLFAGGFILYPFLCRKESRDKVVKYVAPLGAAILLGYLCTAEGYLNDPGKWLGLCYKGMLRGIAGLLLGCMAAGVTGWLNTQELSSGKVYGLRILEIISILGTICYAIFHLQSNAYDFYILILIFMNVVVSFSKFSIGEVLCKGTIFNFLGKFSLAIYLNHYYVKENLNRLLPGSDRNLILILYILFVIVISCVNYALGTGLLKKAKRKICVWISLGLFLIGLILTTQSRKIMGYIYQRLAIEQEYAVETTAKTEIERGISYEYQCDLGNI